MNQPPALDVYHLQSLRRDAPDETTLLNRIETHLATHDGYVSFSGGKDSTAVLDLARRVDPAIPVVWFDSGLEFPETRTYITNLAHHWHLNLHIEPAQPSLLDMLHTSAVFDLDRPTGHLPDLQRICVQEPAARAHARFGPGSLWGVRAHESNGRRIAYATALRTEIARHCHHCCTPHPSPPSHEQRRQHGGIIHRRDGTTTYGPIWDWTLTHTRAYLHHRRIPLNPIYAKLQALGVPPAQQRVNAALDLTHLEHGRIVWLQHGWPTFYNTLATAMPRLRDYT